MVVRVVLWSFFSVCPLSLPLTLSVSLSLCLSLSLWDWLCWFGYIDTIFPVSREQQRRKRGTVGDSRGGRRGRWEGKRHAMGRHRGAGEPFWRLNLRGTEGWSVPTKRHVATGVEVTGGNVSLATWGVGGGAVREDGNDTRGGVLRLARFKDESLFGYVVSVRSVGRRCTAQAAMASELGWAK